MKVLIVSGSRGEWGYYTPIISQFKKFGVEYDILCTNMAPLRGFGGLVDQIESSGENVKYKIYSAYQGDDHYSMAKGFASLSASVADIFAYTHYDWVLLAGDRFEQFAVASVCNLMYLPTAHIQAGELSGNVDGVTRHAIGKLVHLHFAANMDAYKRLVSIGEEVERVVLSGAPQLDELFLYYQEDKHIPTEHRVIAIYHGLTEAPKENFKGVKNMVSFLNESEAESNVIYILPNNDAGGDLIRQYILENKLHSHKAYVNIERREFFKLLASSKYMIGNSSSGLLEAPVYKKFAVNIGGRQRNRVAGKNVIHADYSMESIRQAAEKACSGSSKVDVDIESPYGNAPAAPKIVEKLLSWHRRPRSEILDRRLTV